MMDERTLFLFLWECHGIRIVDLARIVHNVGILPARFSEPLGPGLLLQPAEVLELSIACHQIVSRG